MTKLLDEGVEADLGPRWNALVAASVKLTATPSEFGTTEITALREQGLDDFAITDLIQAAAFFNWANRLMPSICEPTPAAA